MNAAELDACLCEAYEKQAAGYQRALALAESLAAHWLQDENLVIALQPIVAVMDEIGERKVGIEGPRQLWLESRQPASPRLATALQLTAQLIEGLSARIAALEQLATACKNQIAPQLDSLQRARQMQRAYAGAAFRRGAVNG